MEDAEKIAALLEKSGLFEKNALKVLTTLIELEREGFGKVSAHLIAKRTGIKLQNVYKYLNKLVSLRIVEVEKNRQMYFWLSRARPFRRLLRVLRAEFEERSRILEEVEMCIEKMFSRVTVEEKARRIECFDEEIDLSYVIDHASERVVGMGYYFPESSIVKSAVEDARERGVELIFIVPENFDEEFVEVLENYGFKVLFHEKASAIKLLLLADKERVVIFKNGERYIVAGELDELFERMKKIVEESGEVK
jgi:sugar-specific transcriptional regulator TrmB